MTVREEARKKLIQLESWELADFVVNFVSTDDLQAILEAISISQRSKEEQREEEMFGMRAAFGEGVDVVNVFTGKRTRT